MSNGHHQEKSDTQSKLIDQLVCGTLKGPAYREALQWLESHPQRWRDCALAFLQEQAIEEELQKMARESLDWHSSVQPTTQTFAATLDCDKQSGLRDGADQVSPSSLANSNQALPHHSQLDCTISTDTDREVRAVPQLVSGIDRPIVGRQYFPHYSQIAMKLTGLAALLLLSFGVGWMGRSPGDQNLEVVHSSPGQGNSLLPGKFENSDRLASETSNRLDNRSGRNSSFAGTLNSSPDNASQSGLSHLRNVNYSGQDSHSSWALFDSALRNNPAVVGNLSKRLLPIDQEIPKELLELERMGKIRIGTSTAIMPIENEDGTSVLVPVQQLQIVPVVFSY